MGTIDIQINSSVSNVTEQSVNDACIKLYLLSSSFKSMVDDALKDPSNPNVLIVVQDLLPPDVITGVYTPSDWERFNIERANNNLPTLGNWPWVGKDYVIAIATQDFTQDLIIVNQTNSTNASDFINNGVPVKEIPVTLEDIISHEFMHIGQIQKGGDTTATNRIARENEAVAIQDKVMHEYIPLVRDPHVRSYYEYTNPNGGAPVNSVSSNTAFIDPHILAPTVSLKTLFPSQAIPSYPTTTFHKLVATLIQADPLAVDMNGDGHITQTPANAVYFDIDIDGMKEAVSWVGAEDGLLARDVNHNGRIDNASELFGSATQNGFSKLAELDGNHDGQITAADAAFAELKVWQDKNQDGISQADELLSVQDDLFFISLPTADVPSGSGTANITAAIGQLRMENINLTTDQMNTVYGGDGQLTFAALALPELRGYGNIPNLSIAMSLNPVLLTLAQEIAAQPIATIAQNFSAVRAQFDTLLYTWAGVQNIAPDSRGVFLDDARKLSFIENLLHQNFLQYRTSGSVEPLSLPAAAIEHIYDDIREQMLGRFLMQSGADQLYDTAAAYDRLADMMVWDGTPHLNAAFLDALGVQGASVAVPSAFWAGIAYMIDATHTAASTGTGQGFATLTADERTMLDHATHLSDVNLQWQTVQENYLLLLPAAPVVLGAGSDMIFGTAGAHASHAKKSVIAPPFFYQLLGHGLSCPSPLVWSAKHSNDNIPLSSFDTVYCNRRCA
jgi:hypothetical protein